MRTLILSTMLVATVGCTNMEIKQIADSVSDIAGGSFPSNLGSYSQNKSSEPAGSGYQHKKQQYSKSSERFRITEATRMNNEVGLIRPLQTEKNPKGMTMVRVLGYHRDSGADMASTQYFYKVDNSGWLNKDAVSSFSPNAFVVNSGVYYLKVQAKQGEFHATGEIVLQKGVTNIVSVELE
ncbi:hypothetical protein A9Q99_08880 [Gammaproteobacteria bacterium 45_16_T64]|nr:hypothetical protein A9Q99_08880 [Gammaproteobacteria bacterium 45_16_T64]